MAEQLELTDPVVTPATAIEHYKVRGLTMSQDVVASPDGEPGLVQVDLRDNLGGRFTQRYVGQVAIDYMKFVNTGNFSTKSLNKRILERLSSEGVLPGTVTGAPE